MNHDEAAAVTRTNFTRNAGTEQVGNPVTNGNAQAVSNELPDFICPTNGTPKKKLDYLYATDTGAGGPRGAKTNYDFIVNAQTYQKCNWWETRGSGRRIFGENSDTRAAQVTDGLSKTLLLGETTTEER